MNETIEQELRRKGEKWAAFDKPVMAVAMLRAAAEIERLRAGWDAERERCAKIAEAHKGLAGRRRQAFGIKLHMGTLGYSDIVSEERGEDIAAEMIAKEIRASFEPPKDSDPHPRWKPDDKSDRHPQTVAEWDYRNDPVGGAVERSVRRLNVACDYDDHRAPNQMAMVLRIDLSRALHRLTHLEAAFSCWRAGDALSTAYQLQQALAEYLLHLTWKPTRQHIERIRSDVERIVLHLKGITVPPESPGTNGDTAP